MSRKITTLELITLLLCNMMGTSTFYSLKNITKYTNSATLGLLVWIIGCAISVLFGLSYAELGSTYPKDGGDVIYLTKAFSPTLGILYSCTSLFIVIPAYCSLFCTLIFKELLDNNTWKYIIAFIILTFCASIIILGNRILIIFSKFFFWTKILTVLLFVCLSLYTLFFNKRHNESLLFDSTKNIKNHRGFMNLMQAIFNAQWGYDGWNSGNYIASQIYNPKKAFTSGIVAASLIECISVSFIYISLASVLSYSEYIEIDNNAFISKYLNYLGIPNKSTGVSLIATIIPLLGTILTSIVVFKGIAGSILPSNLTSRSRNIVTFTALYALVFLYLIFDEEQSILRLIGIFTTLFYTLSIVGLIKMRLFGKYKEGAYRNPMFIPIAGTCIGIFLIVSYIVISFKNV